MAGVSKAARALLSEAKARGTWGTIRAIKMNKFGTLQYLVGEDAQGNRFFDNPGDTFGRDRWVEYKDVKNFDSCSISPGWHAWLHKMTDVTGDRAEDPIFVRPTTKNFTGTSKAYVPSAHRNSGHSSGPASQKFEAWDPSTGSEPKASGLKDVLDLK